MMHSLCHVAASSIGIDASLALVPETGTVIAVFARSLYVRLGDGPICIGNGTIGDGPLNLLCPALDGLDLRAVVRIGMVAKTDATAIALPPLRINCAGTAVWMPPPVSLFDPQALAFGLAALHAGLPSMLPAGGLGELLRSGAPPATPVERSGAGAIGSLTDWIAGGVPLDSPELDNATGRLLGLGPGLTPSGDDFLAGTLVALRWARADLHHRRLHAAIAAQAPHLTNEISMAHLLSASKGRLHTDLHEVFAAIGGGRASAIATSLSAPSFKTHNSPWDALAGFATTLRTLLKLVALGLWAYPDQPEHHLKKHDNKKC